MEITAQYHELIVLDDEGEFVSATPGHAVAWKDTIDHQQYGDYVFIAAGDFYWDILWEAVALLVEQHDAVKAMLA